MHEPDAFDRQHADDYPEEQDVTCLRCKACGLYWQDTWDGAGQHRAKLFEDGKPHVCKPSTDDFEVVR